MITSLDYSQALVSQSHIAYNLLKKAAIRLQAGNIDQWNYWLDPPQYKIDWLEKGIRNGEYYFVSINHEVVGMYRLSSMDLDYWGPQEIEARYVHSLVVDPKCKGQNLGIKILEKIESDIKSEGISIFRLDCHAGNKRLCQYYVNLGFEKVGEKLMPHSLNNLYEKRL